MLAICVVCVFTAPQSSQKIDHVFQAFMHLGSAYYTVNIL